MDTVLESKRFLLFFIDLPILVFAWRHKAWTFWRRDPRRGAATMANDIEVYIFILVLISVVVLGGTVGRLWILRHRPRTPAVNFSDTAAILFAFAMAIAVGLGFDGVHSELQIQRTYGIEDLRSRLLTARYLKVSRRRNCRSQIGLKKFNLSSFGIWFVVFGTGILCYIYRLHNSIVALEGCIPRILLESARNLERQSEIIALCSFRLQRIDVHWSIKFAIFLLSALASKLVCFFLLSVVLLICMITQLTKKHRSAGPDQCIAVQTIPGMIVQHGSNITSDILSTSWFVNTEIFAF